MLPVFPHEQALQDALAQRIAARPWPSPGDVVAITNDWDGPSIYGSEQYLFLGAGDRVTVERASEGLFFGTVHGDERSGWFGGPGCAASVDITLNIPLGDSPEPPEIGAPQQYAGITLAEEVDSYLVRHSIDHETSQALRALSADIQADIIKSDLSNCRNASAVLLSRINRSRAGTPTTMVTRRVQHVERSRSPPHARHVPGATNAEEFIARLGLDEKVAAELRCLPEDVQRQVIETDLTNARNPSAVVSSRIATVKSWEAQRFGVEEYIERHGVDEDAANTLRACPGEIQQQVVASDLSNARNPSAVLLARIRNLESQVAPRYPEIQVGAPGAHFQVHAPRPPAPLITTVPAAPATPRPMGTAQAVEEYIRRHGLDEKVAADLRALHPSAQEQVIVSGPSNARNPSAVVNARIQSARAPSFAVDAVAAKQLRELPPDVQFKVTQHDLTNVRNPSAVITSRVRSMQ